LPDTPSITIIKSFYYRGHDEEYSNKYHFTGTTPANATAWLALADAIIAAEKLTLDAQTSWTRAYGYEAGNENSVWQYAWPTPVTGTASLTGTRSPGDVAATMRWWTGQTNSNGKKIYCRKYFHAVAHQTLPDLLDAAQKTKFETFGAKLIDGTLPGSFKYCGPQGATLQAPVCNQYLTTRTLKRRGKRRPT